MFQPAPGVWQAVINWETEGEPWANVWHFTGLGGLPLSNPAPTDASLIRGLIGSALMPFLSKTTTLQTVELRLLDSQESPVATSLGLTQYVGAVDSPPVPLNVALCVTLKTGVGGRSGRGRSYLTGMAELNCNARTFESSYTVPLLQAWNLMLSSFNGSSLNQAVLSRNVGGVVRPVGLARLVTVATLTDSRIDTQRRRLR
jgi:hypothetical protein